MVAHNFLSGKAKLSHEEYHQKIMLYLWKLLKSFSKYLKTAILIAAHIKKTAIVKLHTWKRNIFCSIIGGSYMKVKVKEFCVFNGIELLFFDDQFKNNCSKNYILHKKKLRYTFLNCPFLLTEPFSLCVSYYDRNVKKQPFTLIINTKPKNVLIFNLSL